MRLLVVGIRGTSKPPTVVQRFGLAKFSARHVLVTSRISDPPVMNELLARNSPAWTSTIEIGFPVTRAASVLVARLVETVSR
jgi:hypothetical protein